MSNGERDTKVPMADGPVQRAIPEHSCYEWNHIGYHITPDYTAAYCCVCDRIVGFKWREPWRRFVSLFTDEPYLRKEIRFVLWHWWDSIVSKVKVGRRP